MAGRLKKREEGSQRGRLLVASCRSGSRLASPVVEHYRELSHGAGGGGVAYLEDVDFGFGDSETCVRLEQDLSGCDVFLFQALCDPGQG